ncbi:MAG TPA: hypothetical protein VM260_02340, partial [Pirellula sp.]|nr:hypothetical protein [Pirellula sp.]
GVGLVPILAAHQPPKTSSQVHVNDIGTEIELVGRLGRPLGTMVTIAGTWAYPDQSKGPTKVYDLQFTIASVDGTPLATPLTLDVWSMDVLNVDKKSAIPKHAQHSTIDGESWTIRGYETGRFSKTPAEYWHFRVPIAMRATPAFETSIVGFLKEGK